MATKILKQFTSWSFSRWSDYKQCPLKAKLKHLDKMFEPKNDAMARGANIHDQAADYIQGKIPKLPPDLKLFKDEFAMLRKQYKKKINGMVVEDNWAFTVGWDETRWDDWVRCWVRIKLDCAHHIADDTMVVTDWKTGKYREDMHEEYLEQLELYALSALILHPHLMAVWPRLVYLDQGTIYPQPGDKLVYTRSEVPKLIKLWNKRVKPMMNDKVFPPRPNDKCKWCHFRKQNGGPCKF